MYKYFLIIRNIIKNPKYGLYLFIFKLDKYLFHCLPDKYFLKASYFLAIRKELNIKDPKSFNEKLQWLKLYDRKPEYTNLVDKYVVREYIANTIGEEYLIPLLGVWDKFEDIDFEKLPNQFVLKTTHDSGSVLICKDKATFDFGEANKKVNRNLKRNFYYSGREYCYKNVKPRIICEKFMINDTGEEIKDYKFLCFDGNVKCSFVCLNRYSKNGLNVDFYDIDWKPMPFERHYSTSGTFTKIPINYNKMIEFSKKFSKNIPFIRLDFYEINGNLYMGEFTLYPGSGYEEFTPESFDDLLGSWIILPR